MSLDDRERRLISLTESESPHLRVLIANERRDRLGLLAEVVKGLAEGDLVVRQPGSAKDGQRVRALLQPGD